MMVCIFTTTCHLWSILMGVFLSLPEILQDSPLKAIYLPGLSPSSLGQNAQAETPSFPTNQSIHLFDLMNTLIGGTSYSAHIESINLCTSEPESTLGQRICFAPLKKLHIILITLITTPEFPVNIGQKTHNI